MGTLNDRIRKLERTIEKLELKIKDLSRNTEDKYLTPYSKVGNLRDKRQISPVDISTGLGRIYGGTILWNNAETRLPPYGQKVDTPTEGYNKHSHSDYSGGALDINTLEIIEYDINWGSNPNYSKHSQGFWIGKPPIKKEDNDNNEAIEKKGPFAFVFDPNTVKWYSYGIYSD